jgi:hypothetical protein
MWIFALHENASIIVKQEGERVMQPEKNCQQCSSISAEIIFHRIEKNKNIKKHIFIYQTSLLLMLSKNLKEKDRSIWTKGETQLRFRH